MASLVSLGIFSDEVITIWSNTLASTYQINLMRLLPVGSPNEKGEREEKPSVQTPPQVHAR
jgi:hypothetical protein